MCEGNHLEIILKLEKKYLQGNETMDYRRKEIITEKQIFCSSSKCLNMLFMIDLSLKEP